jgi:two-component system sensor histidine kinase/response regulator
MGYLVEVAADGELALQVLSERSFDAVLMDVQMPNLDGYAATRALRDLEEDGRRTPVIAMTAAAIEGERERCLAAGMDDFLAKPIQTDDLWATIDRVVPHAASAADRRGAGTATGVAGAAGGLLAPDVLLSSCGGDGAILRSICAGLRASLPPQLAAVRRALDDGDAARLGEAAHKLCGMVSAFSTLAGAVASDLEDQAARGGPLESARPLVDRLEHVGQRLMQSVASDLTIASLQRDAAAAPAGAADAGADAGAG